MRFFLCGIMQGSHRGPVLHDQDYRGRIKNLLAKEFPSSQIYDPLADHGNSLTYDDVTARDVFFAHNKMCREVDVVIAFVPEASMGSAIEMWEAYQHGRMVVTISPLAVNWAVRYLSHLLYTDIDTFCAAVESGEFTKKLSDLRESSAAIVQAGCSEPRDQV